tara:strand:- start:442 stop:732 length:291 start_codon:yes stop_codon:yes gene_type:complete
MLLFRGVYMVDELEWRSRIWERIPYGLNNVDNSIRYFLMIEDIGDCYQYVERDNYLRLKCWKNNKMVDVNILVDESEDDEDDEEYWEMDDMKSFVA